VTVTSFGELLVNCKQRLTEWRERVVGNTVADIDQKTAGENAITEIDVMENRPCDGCGNSLENYWQSRQNGIWHQAS